VCLMKCFRDMKWLSLLFHLTIHVGEMWTWRRLGRIVMHLRTCTDCEMLQKRAISFMSPFIQSDGALEIAGCSRQICLSDPFNSVYTGISHRVFIADVLASA
jgi:hypothetical protein